MSAESSQQFCLFPDDITAVDLPTETTDQGQPYVCLPGVQGLRIDQGKLVASDNGPSCVTLEKIRYKTQSVLLMVTDTAHRSRVNGLSAPRVSVLRSGDVIEVGEQTLHVSLLNRPYIGPPKQEQLGSKCGYCLLAVRDAPKMRIYVCPTCQQPTHFQDTDVPETDRLQCVLLSSACGHCKAPIELEEGFTYVP